MNTALVHALAIQNTTLLLNAEEKLTIAIASARKDLTFTSLEERMALSSVNSGDEISVKDETDFVNSQRPSEPFDFEPRTKTRLVRT